MKKVIFVFLLTITSMLLGCKSEEVKTVDWYRAHDEARNSLLQKCRNNPGELAQTPNCINAHRAEAIKDSSKTGTLNIKPMTNVKLGET